MGNFNTNRRAGTDLDTPVNLPRIVGTLGAGALSRFSFDHAGHNKHQRVLRTHWCPLPRQRRPQWAAVMGTNESQQLVSAFFLFSLDNASCTPHQQVITTRWCFFSRPCRLHTAPTSHYDLLVFFSMMIMSDSIYFFLYKYIFFHFIITVSLLHCIYFITKYKMYFIILLSLNHNNYQL